MNTWDWGYRMEGKGNKKLRKIEDVESITCVACHREFFVFERLGPGNIVEIETPDSCPLCGEEL